MAKTIDLYIDKNADFTAVMPPITDTDGSAVTLTDYTVEAQMQRSFTSTEAVQFKVDVTDPDSGIVTLSLPKGDTTNLTPTRYLYDVVITNADGYSTRVFEGMVFVNPGITGNPNTMLLNVIEDDIPQ